MSAASDRKPVLLLALTGFIIRNLLLGTFADAVLRRRPLVVAVQNPEDENLREVLRDRLITVIPFPEKVLPYRSFKAMLRTWQTYMYRFKQAERTTKAFEIQSRLFESSLTPAASAVTRLLILTGRLLKRAGLIEMVEDAYLRSIARWDVTEEWSRLLERYDPAVVVSSMLTLSTPTWVSCDLPVVVAARNRRIPCGSLVQSWDNLSSKVAVLPSWLDRYWTWSETMSHELLDLNPRIPVEKIRIVGSPQFDFHVRPEFIEPRETFFGRLGLDPARPVIVMGTGTALRTPREPETVTRLIGALKASQPQCQTLIRLHPKDEGSRWQPFRPTLDAAGTVIQETAPPVHMDSGGFVPPKEFYRDQVNCLAHAAVVINTSSTLTVDAALLDRPVICLGYDITPDPLFPEGRFWAYAQSTHYRPIAATGGVPVVRSEEECLGAIRRYLADPSLDREGRRRIVEVVTGVADGGAGERLAREALALADGRQGEAPR